MIQEINSLIKNKKLILFGEIHGTKEIPELLSKFFSELAEKEDFNLCLEIPDEFQKNIDSFLLTGNENILKNVLFFSKDFCLDGRNSLEYFNLIKNIYSTNILRRRKIKIFCVCPSLAKSQEELEIMLAKNILKIIDKNKTFAILGNVHSSKKEIQIYTQKIIPAGFLLHRKLKDKLFSILLTANKGKFFNNELKNIGPGEDKLFEKNFDFVIRLKEVTPCSFVSL